LILPDAAVMVARILFMARLSLLTFLCFSSFACSTAITQNAQPVSEAGASPAPTDTPRPAESGTTSGVGSSEKPAPATPKIGYSSVHVNGPYIAMTFDDGPSAANTPRLLDLLAKKHIKATFFMVGECAAEYPEIVKRIVAEGHEVANHSWSHPNLAKMSEDAVRSQVQRTQNAIIEAGSVTPKLLRPPYGSITDKQKHWLHDEFGFKIIMWDVDPLDWKYRNSARVEREILKNTRDGSIVLAHDIHPTTVDAMPATFDQLLAKGFKFVTVSELLAMEIAATPAPVSEPHQKEAARKKGEGAHSSKQGGSREPAVSAASSPAAETPQ
jgi:peptidoglycan/xylan/chitin deacetylase (PgdA/CDA1 family)